MAEEKSLAEILQLDEKHVRKALRLLKSHGILDYQDQEQQYFQTKYAEKLGLVDYNFEHGNSSNANPNDQVSGQPDLYRNS